MATTKRAQYRFVVKETGEQAREIREGVVDLVADAFLMAERCDRTPVHKRPLQDPDFLALDLGPGLSVDEAQQVADFLNDRVQYVSITRFGDAEDAARDVKQSERVQRIDLERLSVAFTILKEKLAANDVPGAIEELPALQSIIGDLINEWSKANAMSQAILDAFGKGEGHDAS